MNTKLGIHAFDRSFKHPGLTAAQLNANAIKKAVSAMSGPAALATACRCSHSRGAHRHHTANCLFCRCPSFTAPPAQAPEALRLGKYAAIAQDLLTRNEHFRSLSPISVGTFLKDGRGRLFGDCNFLVRQGVRSRTLHVVLQGEAIVEGPDGEARLKPGALAGDLRAFSYAPRLSSIYALGPVLTLELDATTLTPALREHQDLHLAVMRALTPAGTKRDGAVEITVDRLINAA
jgi:hypothetical protein